MEQVEDDLISRNLDELTRDELMFIIYELKEQIRTIAITEYQRGLIAGTNLPKWDLDI